MFQQFEVHTPQIDVLFPLLYFGFYNIFKFYEICMKCCVKLHSELMYILCNVICMSLFVRTYLLSITIYLFVFLYQITKNTMFVNSRQTGDNRIHYLYIVADHMCDL